ncbi:unnamed protein product [Gulo gulo]|uniref:Uncharacterized protein n=1 Tax=Gulo gulo TaxID=48420 RepID=A0A9X9LCZ4_GULGU|nr:unnamed protein product [Gulo gulo]
MQLVTGRQCPEKAAGTFGKMSYPYQDMEVKLLIDSKPPWLFFSLVEPRSKTQVTVSILGLVQELLSFPAGRTL